MSHFSCTADHYICKKLVFFWVWTHQIGPVVELPLTNLFFLLKVRSGFVQDEIRFIDVSWIITCTHLHIALNNLCLFSIGISEHLSSNSCFIKSFFFIETWQDVVFSSNPDSPPTPFFLLSFSPLLFNNPGPFVALSPPGLCKTAHLKLQTNLSWMDIRLLCPEQETWKCTLPGPRAV